MSVYATRCERGPHPCAATSRRGGGHTELYSIVSRPKTGNRNPKGTNPPTSQSDKIDLLRGAMRVRVGAHHPSPEMMTNWMTSPPPRQRAPPPSKVAKRHALVVGDRPPARPVGEEGKTGGMKEICVKSFRSSYTGIQPRI